MTVINIPAKSIDYLIGSLWVFNFGLLFKIREYHREENLKKDINKQIHKLLKDEIYEKVKKDIINGNIKYKI
jgi:hypothetical protein